MELLTEALAMWGHVRSEPVDDTSQNLFKRQSSRLLVCFSNAHSIKVSAEVKAGGQEGNSDFPCGVLESGHGTIAITSQDPNEQDAGIGCRAGT